MRLSFVTWKCPTVCDTNLVTLLPSSLASLLRQMNGFIQHHGGLHVRGACDVPQWHSLRDAWLGPDAFHKHYARIFPNDIPFAETSLGDQFILRNDQIYFLNGETGELHNLQCGLNDFFERVESEPEETLNLGPLLDFIAEGGRLQAGQLLAVFPPLCTIQAEQGVAFAAVSAPAHHAYLWQLAEKVATLEPGQQIDFRID